MESVRQALVSLEYQRRLRQGRLQRTLVLDKVAHARPSSQHELRDILDDLVLLLGR